MPVEHISALRMDEEGKTEVSFEVTSELPPWDERAELTIVGKRHTRVEGADKVTGRARYSYDIRLPGQLYARVLRSPHPHARVLRVDTSKAAALPGVHAVLGPDTMGESEWYEEKVQLFSPVVRFVGEEVAAVAAESDEIAEDALRLIEVEYEPLPFVIDMKEALRPDAPPIHEGGNQVDKPDSYERGDVESGFREAEVDHRAEVHHPDRAPQLAGAARLHRLVGGRRANPVGLDAGGLGGAQDGGGARRAAGAPCARDQALHGRRLRQQADRLEAHRHCRAAFQAGGPPGAADARPQGREPGVGQPQRDAAARSDRRDARRHADRASRWTSRWRSARTWSAARRATSSVPTNGSTAAQMSKRSRSGPTPTPGRASRSARRATSRGRSRWNRRWTSWRARWRWTRSSCGGATTPSTIRRRSSPTAPRRACASATRRRPRRSGGTSYQKPAATGSEAARHRLCGARLVAARAARPATPGSS